MFSEVFNNILHRVRISQKELAYTAGISESEISKYLSGIKEPKYTQLLKISQALNLPVSQFFNGAVDKFFTLDPKSELFKEKKASEIEEYNKFLVRPVLYEVDDNLFAYKFYTIDNVIGLSFALNSDFIPPTNIKIVKGGITVTDTTTKESKLYNENELIVFSEKTDTIIDIPSGTTGYIVTIAKEVAKFRKLFLDSLINEEAA
ncbi:MAG: hypothetical protein SCALA702_34180 [Melioribacteraceae bacterium]|nr:MAG: hypothetical protein SCALA702_34180 [Melioribacteraceae bacterium]